MQKNEEWGIVGMEKVDTVGVHKQFIDGLACLVAQAVPTNDILPDGGQRLCTKEWSECCQKSSSM